MSTNRKLSRAEQKALRPIQILDAAFEEFVAKGFTATRIEDIADRIGVTKGTIYVYFPTKEDLFSAMIRHISIPIEELLRDAEALQGTCAERLQSLLMLFYDNASDNRHMRELVRFVISEGSRFPELLEQHRNEVVDPLFILTQALLDEGIANGEFRKDTVAVAPVIVAPIIAMMIETLNFDGRLRFDLPLYVRAHLDLVMNGLAARPD